jgi:iron complex outermembrane receptor protein
LHAIRANVCLDLAQPIKQTFAQVFLIPLRALIDVLLNRFIPMLTPVLLSRYSLLSLVCCCLSLIVLGDVRAQTGTVTGSVSNAATRAYLEGAVVEITTLGRMALTDADGRYILRDVPEGTHQVRASYLGLDADSRGIAVVAAQAAQLDFDLSSSVYTLDRLIVTGEREGNAAALTRQRTADNNKNVVSMDAYGNLTNENVGELLVRLPGVAGVIDDMGQVGGIIVRGIDPTLNTFTVDGNLQSSSGGFSRDYRTNSLNAAPFDEVEVIKAPTPDMAADSLGGNVNLKTRSAFAMKKKRDTTYRLSANWGPSFTRQTPRRADSPIRPVANFTHKEIFDAFGGKRNLAISLSAYHIDKSFGNYKVINDYQRTTETPAYLWDYRTTDNLEVGRTDTISLRVDYKLSENTKFYVGTIYNDTFQTAAKSYTMRAFTNQRVAPLNGSGVPTGTNGIMPGYTDAFTEVRAVADSKVQLNSTEFSFYTRERQVQFGGDHKIDRLLIEGNVSYNENQANLGNGRRRGSEGGGVFTMEVASVGWTIDRSASDIYPVLTQTSGSDIYDGGSYRSGLHTIRDNERNTEVWNAGLSATYDLPTDLPVQLKAGYKYREQFVAEKGGDRRWNYIGSDPLSVLDSPDLRTVDGERLGRELPFADPDTVTEHILNNPTQWREDIYYGETRKFIGTRNVTESIDAGYLQGRTRFGKLGILAGARYEYTGVKSFGYLPSRVLTTTAQRNADPIGSARLDQANELRSSGGYGKWFPGAHLNYNFRNGFQARASWSNSIGRPAFTNFLPAQTANVTAQTLTINNAGLKPQFSENVDLSLAYYYEPVGQVSVGYFRKNIRDYIVTGQIGQVGNGPGNGYNGDYEGYTLISSFNGGVADVSGWEINYQQQFTSLPGAFKGLGVFANYTTLTTEGNYGGASRKKNQLAGFVPESGNAGLTYRLGGFSARALVNYKGSYLATYAVDESALYYGYSRTSVNVNVSYQISPRLTVFLDVPNVTNAPQRFYRYTEDRLAQWNESFTTVNFGISGRF